MTNIQITSILYKQNDPSSSFCPKRRFTPNDDLALLPPDLFVFQMLCHVRLPSICVRPMEDKIDGDGE